MKADEEPKIERTVQTLQLAKGPIPVVGTSGHQFGRVVQFLDQDVAHGPVAVRHADAGPGAFVEHPLDGGVDVRRIELAGRLPAVAFRDELVAVYHASDAFHVAADKDVHFSKISGFQPLMN